MDSIYNTLLKVLFGFLAVVTVFIIIHKTRQGIRKIKETRFCPTCNGSGRVKKEENNISGLVN